MQEYDANGDGEIDFDEFMAMMRGGGGPGCGDETPMTSGPVSFGIMQAGDDFQDALEPSTIVREESLLSAISREELLQADRWRVAGGRWCYTGGRAQNKSYLGSGYSLAPIVTVRTPDAAPRSSSTSGKWKVMGGQWQYKA